MSQSPARPPRRTSASAQVITVLVPILNEAANIRAAVEAMRAQRYEGKIEFLLLDGGSTDSTLAELTPLIDNDRRFRLVQQPGSNVPERLNLGLRLATGELIARMDAHALFPPGYLAVGADRLARGDVASVSGPQIAAGSGPWSRRIALALRSPLGRGGARFRRLNTGEVDVDSGYCGIWPRSLLAAHGGWNELAWSGEDAELAVRIGRAGGRIVCVPAMAARYRPRERLSGLALQYGRYAYRRAWIARRHPSALRRSQLLPPLALMVVGCAAAVPHARLARVASMAYVLTVCGESIRIGRRERAKDALGLPAVFATMHFAWGTGFVVGCVRHGVPWRALRMLVGRRPVNHDRRTRP